MEWSVESGSVKGKRHEERGLSCQDSTAFQNENDTMSVSLVDAAGKTDKSAENGKCVAAFLNEFLIKNYKKIQMEDKNTIAYNLMLQIERLLLKNRNVYRVPKEELASTFLAVAIDLKKETYCMIHLGDGAIAIQRKNQEICLESKPCNGSNIRETPLTITENALKYVKIKKGSLKNIQGFLLVSDGIYQRYYDLKKIEDIFNKKNHRVILRKTEDDQAYIKIIFSDIRP